MSPGPETYVVAGPSKPALGVMYREQRFKERQESYSSLLGPGSYEVKAGKGHPGWEFAKSNAQVQKEEEVPGPGHYSQHRLSGSVSFSMAKSKEPLFSGSEKLGPGYYGVPDPYKASVFRSFSSTPRFQEPHQQRALSTL